MSSKEEKKQKSASHVHGNKGVYCGGEWISIEDCADWICPKQCTNKSSNTNITEVDDENIMYDVAIIGAGCIGTSIARQLSRYTVSTILLERDDDVSQGATKGNSGIIHAGYDDKPNTMRSKFCWTGNQMFPKLDRELKFGYVKNGSLVIARCDDEYLHLKKLLQRGQQNGVKNLRIIEKDELHSMEPYLSKDCIAALYSPDAGTVVPYEFTIALAENAAMNGVQIRTRHEVVGIDYNEKDQYFNIAIKKWSYAATSDVSMIKMDNAARRIFVEPLNILDLYEIKMLVPLLVSIIAVFVMFDDEENMQIKYVLICVMLLVCLVLGYFIFNKVKGNSGGDNKQLFHQQTGDKFAIKYDEIAANKMISAKYVINCGGLFADKIANMIGDKSFKIKPRLGEYLLLHKDEGHLAKCTLFPCPDTKIGTKGVLVQATLWGNLILGPTARDTYKQSTQKDSADDIVKYLLTKSKELIPSIDATKIIHSFAGSRAKTDVGDWIISRTKYKNMNFYNVAGIDSPGLAGSPAIAKYVVNQLLSEQGGLKLVENKSFNPYRKPTIFPKNGWRGLKLKRVPKNSKKLILNVGNESQLKKNVVCKCEKVTEYEIVSSLSRVGVNVDTTQAIRRRTRAGMGHCQADVENCNCELYVANIISKIKNVGLNKVGRRPWPATSLLKQRWLNDNDKDKLQSLVK